MKKIAFFTLLLAVQIATAEPAKNEQNFAKIDSLVEQEIAKGAIPGAVVAIATNGKTIYQKAFGNKQVFPDTLPMTTDAVFDLASVSKVISTTTCVLKLAEQGKISLNEKVCFYLPDFENLTDKSPIKIVDLLTHTSGLPPYVGIAALKKAEGATDKNALKNYIFQRKRQFEPREKMVYSCLNFITLQLVIEQVTGQSLRDFARENLFLPLGMHSTDYCPQGELLNRCVPTEKVNDSTVLLGKVHDPLAQIPNGGISGNAGLFSSASDLAIFANMLLHFGTFNNQKILEKQTIEQMLTPPDWAKKFNRTLGWYFSENSENQTVRLSHSGYTGTYIELDFATKSAVIVLTNRVHPNDTGSVGALRKAVVNEAMAFF